MQILVALVLLALPFALTSALEAWAVVRCRNRSMVWIVPIVLGVVAIAVELVAAQVTNDYHWGFLVVPFFVSLPLAVVVGYIIGDKWKARKK